MKKKIKWTLLNIVVVVSFIGLGIYFAIKYLGKNTSLINPLTGNNNIVMNDNKTENVSVPAYIKNDSFFKYHNVTVSVEILEDFTVSAGYDILDSSKTIRGDYTKAFKKGEKVEIFILPPPYENYLAETFFLQSKLLLNNSQIYVAYVGSPVKKSSIKIIEAYFPIV